MQLTKCVSILLQEHTKLKGIVSRRLSKFVVRVSLTFNKKRHGGNTSVQAEIR